VAVELFNAPKELNEAIYARDFGGCVREGYVLGNFKEDVRKHEHEAYEARMAELGITKLGEVTEGVFEGGDFQWLDDHTLAVGMIARTNQKGIDELQAILAPLGYTVIGVPCNPDYLHLDMLFNLIDEKTAIGFRDGLPHEFLEELHNRGIELISAGEEAIFHHYYNVQAIGNKRVISLKQNTFLNHEMQRRGFEVIEVDITEILKDGGGIHCMTFPLKREK
jgi:N-dimethylarginine dimethylaminohydrolase